MPPVDNRRDFEPRWPVCREVRAAGFCRGVQAGDTGYCLRHLDSAGRTAYLADLGPGDDLDLRGIEVDPALLAEVLGAYRDHGKQRFVFGQVRCDHTWFTGRSWFGAAEFNGPASFEDALFSHTAWFGSAVCADRLSFVNARFDGDVILTPVTARWLGLESATFAQPVQIVPRADVVACTNGRFEGGLTLITWAHVIATGAQFGGPSMIADAKVTSLAYSDVSNLVLTEVDLTECRLLGTHRLEQVRIEGQTRFAVPDRWWRARRRMLFEERDESPARVAAAYRALRKSFEDSKNEAGAGDFYYGEMACRRRSKESPVFERVILWCYRLLSGYGQRASRALAALGVLIAVVTGLLALWGQDFGLAARTALGAVVFRDDRLDLTAAGEWTVLVARFLGPVLLALAVLAVRARVKR